MAHEIEGVGTVSLEDPLSKAEMIASQARKEQRLGTAEPLGKDVVFEDHPGPDKGATAWKSSATTNKVKKANCNSITLAAIHGVEAPDGTVVPSNPSHVGVVRVPQQDGASRRSTTPSSWPSRDPATSR